MTGQSLIPWFILAIILAPFTIGLTIVGFFIAKYLVDKNRASKLAISVFEAAELTASAIQAPPANNAAIRLFFKEYGTTEKKYDMHEKPFMYSGYVRVAGGQEFLTTIIKTNTGLVIASYLPPISYGNDLLSLMGKAEFHKSVISGLQRG